MSGNDLVQVAALLGGVALLITLVLVSRSPRPAPRHIIRITGAASLALLVVGVFGPRGAVQGGIFVIAFLVGVLAIVFTEEKVKELQR